MVKSLEPGGAKPFRIGKKMLLDKQPFIRLSVLPKSKKPMSKEGVKQVAARAASKVKYVHFFPAIMLFQRQKNVFLAVLINKNERS